MATATTSSHSNRIFSLDVLRGIAVLGILIINIYGFSYGLEFGHNPLDMGLLVKQSDLDILIFRITQVIAEGKMRGIFSILFGVSAMLILSSCSSINEIKGADIYYRRLIWLLIFGLFNGFILLWWGDILYAYSLCGLLLFPLRKASLKVLIVVALLIALSYTLRSYIRYYETKKEYIAYQHAKDKISKGKILTANEKEAREVWIKKLIRPGEDKIKEVREKMSGSYGSIFLKNLETTQFMESVIFYRALFFDTLLMMLLGMILFKIGFFETTFSVYKLWMVVLIGYGVGLPLVLWAESRLHFGNYQALDKSVFNLIYSPERILLTLAHITAVLLLLRLKVMSWIGKLLSSTGKMAFTNYLFQSVICMFLFSGFGLNLYGKLSISELMIIVMGICFFEIVMSSLWLNFFSMGPCEWLWRSLTHWKIQSIRK
jgi:uncharacterized protein